MNVDNAPTGGGEKKVEKSCELCKQFPYLPFAGGEQVVGKFNMLPER